MAKKKNNKKIMWGLSDRESWNSTAVEWGYGKLGEIADKIPGMFIHDVPVILPSGNVEVGNFIYVEQLDDEAREEMIGCFGDVYDITWPEGEIEYTLVIPKL